MYIELCVILRYMAIHKAGHVNRKSKNNYNVGQAQRDGRPPKYRWRSLLNATKFG